METGFKGGKIPPEIVHEEYDETDHLIHNYFNELKLVNKKIGLKEDKMVAEFIYNNHLFDKHYVIDKEEVLNVFKFYLTYKPVIDDLRRNKLPNIIKRKIKQIKWKHKKIKQYKQHLK